jgi:hypothetical protein
MQSETFKTMSEELKKMAKLRAAAVAAVEKRIKNKKINPVEGQEILQDLEVGRKTPMGAIHQMERMATLERQTMIWDSEHNLIPEFENYVTDCDDFPPRPDQCAIAVTMCRHVRIMTLFGPSSTGKTTAAARCVEYLGAMELADDLVAITGYKLATMSTHELFDFIEIATSAPLLVIDDLDKGIRTGSRAATLLEILSAREHNDVKTIVTTNLVGAELADLIEKSSEGFGIPLVSRLRRGFSIDFGPTRIPRWFKKMDEQLCKIEKRNRNFYKDPEYEVAFRKLEWRYLSAFQAIMEGEA